MSVKRYVIVVTGSRHWTDQHAIDKKMAEVIAKAKKLADKVLVVHGDARGVDKMAAKAAQKNGACVHSEPYGNFRRYGYAAGLKRNEFMIDTYKPNLLVAFRAAGKSSGTDHCIAYASKKEIPTELTLEDHIK